MMSEKKPKVILYAAFMAYLCLVVPVQGFARDDKKVSRLNEDNVRVFIEKTTDVTSGKTRMSADEVSVYLDRHLDKKGFFRSEMTYRIPGFPSQENALSLDKEQFIESVLDGKKSLSDYETDVTIKDIKISSDGKRAVVETKSREKGDMPLPGEDGKTQKVPVEGVSSCSQTLKLNEKMIQMYSADCKTEIMFKSLF